MEGHFSGTNSCWVLRYFPNSLCVHWDIEANTGLHQVEGMRNVLKGNSTKCVNVKQIINMPKIFYFNDILFCCCCSSCTAKSMPTHTATRPQKMNTAHVKNYIISQNINGKIKTFNHFHAFVKNKSSLAAFCYIYTSLPFHQHGKVSHNVDVTYICQFISLYTACVGYNSTALTHCIHQALKTITSLILHHVTESCMK